MSFFIMRKLKVKYVGSSAYRPKTWVGDNYVPVVGFTSFTLSKKYPDGNERDEYQINYLILDCDGKIIPVAAFNCHAIVDEQAENEAGKLSEALHNSTVILKTLSQWVKVDKDKNETGK